jgi:hypothetical protein
MFGGNRQGRRESAIARRLKNLNTYASVNDIDKGKKAFKDIACTCRNLNIEVPAEAKNCLNKLNLKEEDVIQAKVKATEAVTEEVPENVFVPVQE